MVTWLYFVRASRSINDLEKMSIGSIDKTVIYRSSTSESTKGRSKSRKPPKKYRNRKDESQTGQEFSINNNFSVKASKSRRDRSASLSTVILTNNYSESVGNNNLPRCNRPLSAEDHIHSPRLSTRPVTEPSDFMAGLDSKLYAQIRKGHDIWTSSPKLVNDRNRKIRRSSSKKFLKPLFFGKSLSSSNGGS